MSNTIAISFNCMDASEIFATFVMRVDDDDRSYRYLKGPQRIAFSLDLESKS